MKKKSTDTPEKEAAEKPARGEGVRIEAGGEASGEAVFRDIVRKASEGNIKYQELYLKYIDLISGSPTEDEVIYVATFVDDKDQEA